MLWSQKEYKTEAARQLNDRITYAPISQAKLPSVLRADSRTDATYIKKTMRD